MLKILEKIKAMARFNRLKCSLLILLGLISLCLHFIYTFSPNTFVLERTKITVGQFFDQKPWIQIPNTKAWIFSAYVDARGGGCLVHIFGFSFHNHTSPAMCSVFNATPSDLTIATSVLSIKHIINPHASFSKNPTISFWATDYRCAYPKYVCHKDMRVTVHQRNAPPESKLSLPLSFQAEEEKYEGDFVVCISPLSGNVSQATLVEAMERNLYFGADLVAIYDQQIPAALDKVIEMYRKEGNVEIVGWHMPDELGNKTHYSGQNLAINDCLYRFMTRFRYVIITDLDEVITPLRHDTWNDMMSYLTRYHQASSYIFKHVQYRYNKTNLHSINPSLLKVNRIVAQQKTPSPSGSRSKMVMRPDKVLSVGVHEVFKSVRWFASYVVPDDVGILSHVTLSNLSISEFEQNKAWKYAQDLQAKYDQRMQQVQKSRQVRKPEVVAPRSKSHSLVRL